MRSFACRRKRQRGVTLVELMVTLAVLAILLAVGIPSWSETIRNNRLESAAHTFLNALNYARTEAIRRGQSVTVRKSGSQWEEGYFAFVDLNANGEEDSGETRLRTWPALPSGYTLRTSAANFANFIRYNSRGEVANNAVGGTFAICYQNQLAKSRAVIVTPLRPVLAADRNGNTIPESDNGDIGSCAP